jgi:hypothetical protein
MHWLSCTSVQTKKAPLGAFFYVCDLLRFV